MNVFAEAVAAASITICGLILGFSLLGFVVAGGVGKMFGNIAYEVLEAGE